MKTLIDEKTEYQAYFIERLIDAGYRERVAKEKYDKRYAMDTEELLTFLRDTQPEEMATLEKIHKDNTDELVIAKINQQISQSSLLDVLKDGVEITGTTLKLIYNKPATSYNPTLEALYKKNRFTVMQEVVISDHERVDLILFVNGLAVVSCELKSEYSRQNYRHAIDQYTNTRDPNNRLFKFKVGTVVNFAMDLNEVYMTTKLDGINTTFLPFNRGCGEGVKTGAGNPLDDGVGEYPVHYMWDDVLTPDSMIELLMNFCFTIREEKKDPETSEKSYKEKLIFPRYHQRDAVRKLLADIYDHESSLNYLIEHSAGSGKTNTICWLAHRLSSLHNKADQQIFDNVLIITDRLVVDQQLQKAVKAIDHKDGLIRAIGEESGDDSSTLRDALKGNTKIIVTTIQKFLYLDFNELAKELNNKKFAVIIDEAHSSTSGKDMSAVQNVLGAKGSIGQDDVDESDLIEKELSKNGKQVNVSVFAFTATPKPTTLQLFGTDTITPEGAVRKSAFHLYSMRQAIEEGFILDVLNNYTEYNTFYKVLKSSEDDPTLKTADAKKQIYHIAMVNPENIEQRIAIIVAHFRDNVRKELDGQAKAMIVTNWREEAVRYYFTLKKYLQEHDITDIKPLVAFTGKVKLEGDETEYTERGINGFAEDKLPDEFNTDRHNTLIVANKYQVGFDQPKLSAMYVMKPLAGVNAVQTLSRLNRTCAPYTKKTFILDFINTYEDMENAFAPYYTTTILKNTATVSELRDKAEEIDGFGVITDYDVDVMFKIIHENAVKDVCGNANVRTRISANAAANQLIRRAIQIMNNMFNQDESKKKQFISACRSYVRLYEFLSLITGQIDSELFKKYLFLSTLLTNIDFGTNNGVDISKKVNMIDFKNLYNKNNEGKNNHISKPFVNLPTAEVKLTKDEEQLLSSIIEDINAASGQTFDTDVATKAMLQIKDLLMKNENLKIGAKNNNENDFSFSFYDDADEALLEGLMSNNEFFTLLLNDGKLKKRVLDAFKHSVYTELKKD
jgi:hypothetical protein